MPPASPPGPTVTLPPADSGVTRTRTPAGSPQFDEDTRDLLWWRLLELHIAALVVMIVLTLLAAGGALDTPSIRVPDWGVVGSVVAMAELVGGAVFLWRRPDLSLRGLR